MNGRAQCQGGVGRMKPFNKIAKSSRGATARMKIRLQHQGDLASNLRSSGERVGVGDNRKMTSLEPHRRWGGLESCHSPHSGSSTSRQVKARLEEN